MPTLSQGQNLDRGRFPGHTPGPSPGWGSPGGGTPAFLHFQALLLEDRGQCRGPQAWGEGPKLEAEVRELLGPRF